MGFFVRLIRRDPRAWESVRQHRFLLLMLAAYLVSFAMLGFFSRTIVRVFLAILVSMLTFELLVTRSQLRRACVTLVIAAAMDAAYGLYFVARGMPLHEFRFSGMSGVNFSAMVIITGAGVATALTSRATSAANDRAGSAHWSWTRHTISHGIASLSRGLARSSPAICQRCSKAGDRNAPSRLRRRSDCLSTDARLFDQS